MLKGALLGAGKIAQNGHLPAYRDAALRDRGSIVAVVDPSPEGRRVIAEALPELRVYPGTEAMFAAESVDFIDICAPPSTHLGLIELGAMQDVHMLCEKPLAIREEDAASARAVLQARRDLVFMPCHQYRYSPIWSAFKQLLDEKRRGSGFLVQFNVYRTQADPGLPTWNPAWRTDRSISGGGILADTGVHYLYLILWMLGAPATVSARTMRLKSGPGGVEDTAAVTLGFPDGLAQITLTWAADRRANSARAIAGDGSIVYDGETLMRLRGQHRELIPVPDASDKRQYVALYVSLLGEFFDRIDRGAASDGWVREASDSIRLLRACYRSAEEGQTIPFSTEP